MLRFAAIIGLLLLLIAYATNRASAPIEQGGIAVVFSPDGGAAGTVVDAVRSAKRTLDVAAYHITHPNIAREIVAANRRGVSVRVIMDSDQSRQKYSSATYLFNAGIPVRIWTPGMMHNKYLIIDGQTIVTGSFNFTKSADESNAENLLVIQGKSRIAAAYRQNFEKLLQSSKRYAGVSGE